MKITTNQRNAASFYFMSIATGIVKPKGQRDADAQLTPFIAILQAQSRRDKIEELSNNDPTWNLRLMNELDHLLIDADDSLTLTISYDPEGLLAQACERARLPHSIFPSVNLSLSFDNKDNIIVDGDIINADEYLKEQGQDMVQHLQAI